MRRALEVREVARDLICVGILEYLVGSGLSFDLSKFGSGPVLHNLSQSEFHYY